MNSGPSTSARSSRKRYFGRGANSAIAVMGALSLLCLAVVGLPSFAVEVAQLALAHRKRVPRAGADAVERHVRGQLRRHFALRLTALDVAVEDALGAEVLHPIDT